MSYRLRRALLILHGGELRPSPETHRAADRTFAVFRFAKDGESKNPRSNDVIGLLCRGGRFLLPTFLSRQQRKVGRAKARKPLTFGMRKQTPPKKAAG
jgi:hypothetical protein